MGGVKHWGKCGCMNSTELKRIGTSSLRKLVHCHCACEGSFVPGLFFQLVHLQWDNYRID